MELVRTISIITKQDGYCHANHELRTNVDVRKAVFSQMRASVPAALNAYTTPVATPNTIASRKADVRNPS
eukprot:6206763-Pleurochrysis_carterae.AAC.6